MNKKQTKALVLLNMGAARSKDELKVFLLNMFNDKNILSIKNNTLRSIIASLIVMLRHDKAWKNYEEIGGESPLHKLTDLLINKLKEYLPEYYIVAAMRYTSQFSQTTIAKIQDLGIKDITLLPLYPQYSTTTTKSSLDDFIEKSPSEFDIRIIEPFYKNKLYNNAIIENIKSTISNYEEYNLIFSAHGLPQKIIDNGDPYQKQIEHNVEILSNILQEQNIKFKSISLAYQSKVGPMKWIEPSLDKQLENFKEQNVLIYPIAFIIDNSETVFELEIEYKEIAKELGIVDYKVVKCLNDSEMFCQAIKELII
jgi:ferrochelatase